MSKPSVIVIGPAACGKTRHAEALRRHFKLNTIIDDASPRARTIVPPTGALVLTIEPLIAPAGVRTVNYVDAIAAAGIKPIS